VDSLGLVGAGAFLWLLGWAYLRMAGLRIRVRARDTVPDRQGYNYRWTNALYMFGLGTALFVVGLARTLA
jgi:hypothetical protein